MARRKVVKKKEEKETLFKAAVEFFFCLIGVHNVPEKWCFERRSKIFYGGTCPRCGKPVTGKFLCGAEYLWSFEDVLIFPDPESRRARTFFKLCRDSDQNYRRTMLNIASLSNSE